MNQIVYLVLFVIVILIYLKYQQESVDNFKTNLCKEYEDNGTQCPYRIHYRKGHVVNNSLNDIQQTTSTEKITSKSSTTLSNNNGIIINTQCNRGGNGDKINKVLVEGKDYINVFGKYPVIVDDSRKLNRYPWWREY